MWALRVVLFRCITGFELHALLTAVLPGLASHRGHPAVRRGELGGSLRQLSVHAPDRLGPAAGVWL